MGEMTAVEMVRGLYGYHQWANRRLFDVAAGLGEDVAGRDVGQQFSYSTIRRMLGHLYGADWLWLQRWQGSSPTSVPGAEFTSLAQLRGTWDQLEAQQRAFIDALTGTELGRVVEFKNTEGKTYRVPLGPLVQHVANHATHHRSEIATMITMVSTSPPDTGINSYLTAQTGQS